MSLPFADVAFQSSPRGQRQPSAVHIRQVEYRHDVAVITMDFESKVAPRYEHGAPVTIAWGWLPDDVNYFHGYVHHTTQSQAQQERRTLDIYCVGASYRLKQARFRTFARVRAHQLAARVARDNRLSLTAVEHPQVHARLNQAGRSDWDFLVSVAKRCGLVLYCTRTDLVLARRQVETGTRQRPTFRYTPGVYRQRGAVYDVKHAVGESTPGTEVRARVARGVTADGALVSAARRRSPGHGGTRRRLDPVFTKVSRGEPVVSAADAAYQLEGEAELHRFGITATARLSGSAQVHQGSTLRITELDADSDGFWYVTKADHRVTRTDYTLEVELARDEVGDAGTEPVDLSVSGKPVLVTGCEVGVDSVATPAAATIYDPVDDCSPVEAAVAQGETTQQLPFDTRAVRTIGKRRRSPARAYAAPAARTPLANPFTSRSRAPQLTGWRAVTSSVRVKS